MANEDLDSEVYSVACDEAFELLKNPEFRPKSASGEKKIAQLYEESTDSEREVYWPILMEGFLLKGAIFDLK